MFLRAENRIGGPTDPITGFEASINLLFPGRYPNFTSHPMHEYMAKFSFGRTPLEYAPEKSENDETKTKTEDGSRRLLKLTFADVSSEI